MLAVRKPRDGCVVATEALAPLLEDFIACWERQHPDLATNSSAVGNSTVGGLQILYERTCVAGRDGSGTRVPLQTIRNVLLRRSPWTEFRTADALLVAIRRVGVLYDGTLEVRPNPLAPGRASCC